MVTRRTLTTSIREDLNRGNYLNAVLQTSADLELLFFSKLFFEKGINRDLIENWTLGKYLNWICKLKLIDIKYEQLLEDFSRMRNLIVHQRSAFGKAVKNLDTLNYLAHMILLICDFIDSSPVEYKHNQDLENEYMLYSEKMEKRYGEAFSKKLKIVEESLK